MAAVLAPGDRTSTRLTGYAGATLALGCLLRLGPSDPPRYDYYPSTATSIRFGMWLCYLTTVLTIAAYIHRDLRTRGTITPSQERLVPPAMLLALFAITLIQPAHLEISYKRGHWSVLEVVGNDGPVSIGVLVGLVTTLATMAALVPGAGVRTRLTGYAGAALAVGCLLRLDWSFSPPTVSTTRAAIPALPNRPTSGATGIRPKPTFEGVPGVG